MRAQRPKRGFTLTELTIVLTMLGILTTMAMPKIAQTRTRLTLEAATHEFARSFAFARSEAIRRNQTVTITPSGDTAYVLPTIGYKVLPKGARFTSTPAANIRFASFGPPVSGVGTYQITYKGRVSRIEINAAGFVRVR